VVGDARRLGKPVGSDIREGKATLLMRKALDRANDWQRNRIVSTLGDSRASEEAVDALTRLLRDLGVIQYAQDISHRYVDEALGHLRRLPASDYRSLLGDWAHYLIQREF